MNKLQCVWFNERELYLLKHCVKYVSTSHTSPIYHDEIKELVTKLETITGE